MIKTLKYALPLLLCALSAKAETPALEDMIEEVNPSVVSIAADIEDETQALGAGIIVGADGYVVTNAHVTEGARKITVVTPDDEYYEAVLVGADAKTDVALLRVKKPLGLEPARFDDSDEIRVGSRVFAIGNPFGLGNSVSLGIISAKERDIEKGPYDSFIQTDAAINQGSSGGPLFNMNGGIIGMNTAIFSTDGKNMGIGFATPSNTVRWVVEQLKQNGRVVRGWLGISVQKVRSKNADKKNALAVAAMAEDSPAAKAGVQVGDVIEALGEIPLNNPRVFSLEVAKLTPGTSMPLTIKRGDAVMDVQVQISEMPRQADEQQAESDKTASSDIKNLKSLAELGLDKYSIRKAVKFAELGLEAYFDEQTREFVVVSVQKGAEAASKGVKTGDRFNRINGAKIFGVEDLRVKIKEAAGGQLNLTMRDKNDIYTVMLKRDSVDE